MSEDDMRGVCKKCGYSGDWFYAFDFCPVCGELNKR